MSQGFEVDLDVLDRAATSIARTMNGMEQCEVEDIVGPEEDYGHDALREAFAHFCDRWQEGVELLVDDGATIVSALNRAVDTYMRVDESPAQTFKTHGSGADPAVGAVDD